MSLDKILKNVSCWMKVKGPMSDVVISSRIRIARNLINIPFPLLITPSKAKEVVDLVNNSLKDKNDLLKNLQLIYMNDLSDVEKKVLVEKHLISPLLAETSRYGAVLLNENESISIMLNEEDHLRIQCIFPGFQLEESWELANKIDDFFERHLSYAFDDRYGYLTSCPTNVGTGIRASVMVHLPALAMLQQLQQLLPAITQVGLTVRGIYGEGSEALGNLYQISNQITLGQSENEIIDKLQGVVRQIIEHEFNARKMLLKESRVQLEDRIYRSYGILKNSRIIDSKEAMKKLSDVRLGCDLNLIPNLPFGVINELMVMVQPGFLQQYMETFLDSQQRDIKRSLLIRKHLANVTKED